MIKLFEKDGFKIEMYKDCIFPDIMLNEKNKYIAEFPIDNITGLLSRGPKKTYKSVNLILSCEKGCNVKKYIKENRHEPLLYRFCFKFKVKIPKNHVKNTLSELLNVGSDAGRGRLLHSDRCRY